MKEKATVGIAQAEVSPAVTIVGCSARSYNQFARKMKQNE
jgi:hypothetical protein